MFDRIALSMKTCLCIIFSALTLPAAANPQLLWKFDFGDGKTADGYTQVKADTLYTPELGYGFLPGPQIKPENRKTGDALTEDFCTSDVPFFFTFAVPEEGNYRVTITLGDNKQATDTTVKAESRRLMAESLKTQPGEFIKRTFMVNIRNSQIDEKEKVRLKKREIGVMHWDNQLTLEFNGPRPCICGVEIKKENDVITVFLAGDSTVTDQTKEPWTSWGQMLTCFFTQEAAVANYAESGETLRAFVGEKRLKKLLTQMKAGDYLFVQFAHNDMKRGTPEEIGYADSLKQFIDEAHQRGAYPVLVTSMHRRSFDEDGKVIDTMQGFPDAMRAVAKEQKVPLIDLNAMSKALYEALGSEGSAIAFVDGTHHNAYGAYEMARCVVQGIRTEVPELARYLSPDTEPFNPAEPDPAASFSVPASPSATKEKPEGS